MNHHSAPDRHARYKSYPTIVHALKHAAELRPDAPALKCGDQTLSFSEYWCAVSSLASQFADKGAKGGRIAVVMRNGIEMAVTLFAGMAAGAQVAPLNPMYTASEAKPLLNDTDACILICDQEFAEKGKLLADEVGIPSFMSFNASTLTIASLRSTNKSEMALPGAFDPSVIFFTGGTTGVPKGVNHTHSSLMSFCYSCVALWPLPLDEERILNVAPLFHIWGFAFTLLYPVYTRAFMDILPAYKPAAVLSEIQSEKISVFAGGPAALYLGLRSNENFSTTDFSSLKYSLSGGAPCPLELLREWKDSTGADILEAWGMSEGSPIACNPLHQHKAGSVGIVAKGTDIEVVDLDTGLETLGCDEVGEIRVRGAQFTKGYRNRPDETAATIRGGWLYTGDIGKIDKDGFIFLVDRKKEMILVGGYNVYPREVDELLFKHPSLLEAATIGIPDSFSGEAVKSFVVCRPGMTISADELRDYCAEHLVKYKVPKFFEFVESLPRSGVGKLDKLALKARK